jgi:hypothetical protein
VNCDCFRRSREKTGKRGLRKRRLGWPHRNLRMTGPGAKNDLSRQGRTRLDGPRHSGAAVRRCGGENAKAAGAGVREDRARRTASGPARQTECPMQAAEPQRQRRRYQMVCENQASCPPGMADGVTIAETTRPRCDARHGPGYPGGGNISARRAEPGPEACSPVRADLTATPWRRTDRVSDPKGMVACAADTPRLPSPPDRRPSPGGLAMTLRKLPVRVCPTSLRGRQPGKRSTDRRRITTGVVESLPYIGKLTYQNRIHSIAFAPNCREKIGRKGFAGTLAPH